MRKTVRNDVCIHFLYSTLCNARGVFTRSYHPTRRADKQIVLLVNHTILRYGICYTMREIPVRRHICKLTLWPHRRHFGRLLPLSNTLLVQNTPDAATRQSSQPLPPPTGASPYHLSLDQVLTPAAMQEIQSVGRMVLHVVGGYRRVKTPQDQDLVVAQMGVTIFFRGKHTLRKIPLKPLGLQTPLHRVDFIAPSPPFLLS